MSGLPLSPPTHLVLHYVSPVLAIDTGSFTRGTFTNTFVDINAGKTGSWEVHKPSTETNKSAYIDSFLGRSVNAFNFVEQIRYASENKENSWYQTKMINVRLSNILRKLAGRTDFMVISRLCTFYEVNLLRHRFMKHFIFHFLLLIIVLPTLGQPYLDTLQQRLSIAKDDTSRIIALTNLSNYYAYIRIDSSLQYAKRANDLSEKENYPYGKFLCNWGIAFAYTLAGDYPKALQLVLNGLHIAEELSYKKQSALAQTYLTIGVLYKFMGDTANAFTNLREAIRLQETSGESIDGIYGAFTHMSSLYQRDNPDSFLFYAQKGYDLGQQSIKSTIGKARMILAAATLGNAWEVKGSYPLAKKFYYAAIQQAKELNNLYYLARVYTNLAGLWSKSGNHDSTIYYARNSLEISQQYNFALFIIDASSILVRVYGLERKQDSTLKYTRVLLEAKENTFSKAKMQQFELIGFNEQQRAQQIVALKAEYRNRSKMYLLMGVLGVFILFAFIQYRNKIQKQKANAVLENTLSNLKSTQSQLVQSEKMASLGELTAGIAHEIQNPLNFVNNFAQVNEELIDEAEQANKAGKAQEVSDILASIKGNQNKINQHGQRADAIVKSMLQHARSTTGQKEPTDLNALADEYLRLSYQGIRARDKSFNVTLHKDFDVAIGKIDVIPEDIGRVLLNLYNNAFYAASEKKKQQPVEYEPTLSVTTRKLDGKVEIRVRDNGNGIPQKVIDKIFQPFFTTKPSGQGTGLGLSLSYDIVKAHGGDIVVATKPGESTEFTVTLPDE